MTKRYKYGLVPYFRYSPDVVEYLVHISVKNQLMFVEVPKAGCTVVKTVLQLDESSGAAKQDAASVHNRDVSPLAELSDLPGPRLRHFSAFSPLRRITFVRNPFSRAVSCYLDKVVGTVRERRIRLPYLGLPPDAEVTFEEFLRQVKRQRSRKMDIHWAPQTHLLAYGRVRYHYIGRFESLQHDLGHLIDELRLTVPPGVVEKATPHTTNAGDRLAEFYDRGAAVSLVRDIYRRDFRELGYGLSPVL